LIKVGNLRFVQGLIKVGYSRFIQDLLQVHVGNSKFIQDLLKVHLGNSRFIQDFVKIGNSRFIYDLVKIGYFGFDKSDMIKANQLLTASMIDFPLFFVAEFDNWYAESFLNQSDDPQTSVAAGHGIRPGIFIPYNPNQVDSLPLI
jgi:hypothetical protein